MGEEMKTEKLKLWVDLPCSADTAFRAWLDDDLHAKMLDCDDDEVIINPHVGGHFSIWNDSITGTTTLIDPQHRKVVQEWVYEYDDWPKDRPSLLTVQFVPLNDSECSLQLWQTDLPSQHADSIAAGWKEYYFKPMQDYFSSVL